MIGDIIGSIILPHILAILILFRVGMLNVRPTRDDTVRESFARLWAWGCARWPLMVMHPLYWAATGAVTAFFLVAPLRSLFI